MQGKNSVHAKYSLTHTQLMVSVGICCGLSCKY